MIKNILKSIQAYFKSFALISKLKLWKYFFIPILISIATAILITALAYFLSDNLGSLISKIWVWDWGKKTFASVSTVISAIAIVAIGFILYRHIVMALSAPFMSPVSEKIELHLLGANTKGQHRKTTFNEQLWRGIRINIRNLIREIGFTILFLILGLIPVIGILSAVFLFLVQAYYAGFGNMDYTLERHFKYRKSILFVKKNRGYAIGNGTVFTLMLLIPVIGVILVLPFSVTAASIVTVDALKKEAHLVQSDQTAKKSVSNKV